MKKRFTNLGLLYPPLRGKQVAQFSLQIEVEGWWQEGHLTIKQMPCYKNADICCGDP